MIAEELEIRREAEQLRKLDRQTQRNVLRMLVAEALDDERTLAEDDACGNAGTSL
jgi:hypothetical protein